MKDTLTQLIQKFVPEGTRFTVEHPSNIAFGDYSTNAGIVTKDVNGLAEKLTQHKPEEIERIEVKNGFINFYLSKKFFADSLKEIIEKGDDFGKNEGLSAKKVMVEYTDPNIMKAFHIGHLMSNAIGEALSRIVEWSGAETLRANYYSDSGLNVAKAVWGMRAREKQMPKEEVTLSEKAQFLGQAYAYGVKESEANLDTAQAVREVNMQIADRSNVELNDLYDTGKRWSLAYFNELYTKLGSTFDWLVGESEVAEEGKQIVLEHPGTFVESQGAIVFPAEEYNAKFHTRVFINRDGLPTYEAKEIGLTKKKFEEYKLDRSIVVTANEQNDYFKVVLEAIKQVYPDFAMKTEHISHGVLRLTTGKMSSRTGDVITAESLIEEVKEKTQGSEMVAIGAIKFMILRAAIGGDIIFDVEKSVSTEGDSGVYLQYAHARTASLLEKAGKKGSVEGESGETREVEKLLYRFPEVVKRALEEYAPHYIATYLLELSGAFNNFYAHEHVISDDPEASYRLAIAQAFKIVLKNGLTILGIPAPEKM